MSRSVECGLPKCPSAPCLPLSTAPLTTLSYLTEAARRPGTQVLHCSLLHCSAVMCTVQYRLLTPTLHRARVLGGTRQTVSMDQPGPGLDTRVAWAQDSLELGASASRVGTRAGDQEAAEEESEGSGSGGGSSQSLQLELHGPGSAGVRLVVRDESRSPLLHLYIRQPCQGV